MFGTVQQFTTYNTQSLNKVQNGRNGNKLVWSQDLKTMKHKTVRKNPAHHWQEKKKKREESPWRGSYPGGECWTEFSPPCLDLACLVLVLFTLPLKDGPCLVLVGSQTIRSYSVLIFGVDATQQGPAWALPALSPAEPPEHRWHSIPALTEGSPWDPGSWASTLRGHPDLAAWWGGPDPGHGACRDQAFRGQNVPEVGGPCVAFWRRAETHVPRAAPGAAWTPLPEVRCGEIWGGTFFSGK